MRHFRLWILAGLMTTLAWWTKYNGWLPLAIGLSGLAPWLIFNQQSGESKSRYLICCGLISVIAYLIWVPVLFGLGDVAACGDGLQSGPVALWPIV